ncbi:MAG: hypothetical protein PHD74_03770 [Candidatus Krumholzibacteria bacterium]|nr:hypothetical protein [Candidatus Krumholzibacteria bacterium]
MNLPFFAKISLIYLLRSIARMVSAVNLIFVAMLIAGAGLPDFHSLARGEIVSLAMLVAMLAGLVIAWWRELPGAILILGGFFVFMASEYATTGDTGISWIFMLFPVSGALFLIYWGLTRK